MDHHEGLHRSRYSLGRLSMLCRYATACWMLVVASGCSTDTFKIVSPLDAATVRSPVHIEFAWGSRSTPKPTLALDGVDISRLLKIDTRNHRASCDVRVNPGQHRLYLRGVLYSSIAGGFDEKVYWYFTAAQPPH